MTFQDVDLHPIAGATLEYFAGADRTKVDVDPPTFLAEVFALVDRMPAPEAVIVLDDALIVCRFLEIEGNTDAAIALAKQVEACAKRATVRAVGAGGLTDRTQDAGERFGRFLRRK